MAPKSTALLSFDDFFKAFPARVFKKKTTIINSGVTPQDIYYLKRGYAKAYAVSPEGQELTMVIFQPGDFFPLISTVEARRLEYYIESLTEVEVISVPRSNFIELLKKREDLLTNLILRLTARFEGVLTRMEYLVFGSAAQKVASIIMILGERFGVKSDSATTIQAPLTHKDLAALVGITRETTTLILRELTRKKYIAFQNRHLIIKNLRGLQKESLSSPG